MKKDNYFATVISNEVKFYTIEDLMKMLGWSKTTVQKLFNDPNFPAANYGQRKVVESHALIEFFCTRHDKEDEPYWNGKEK